MKNSKSIFHSPHAFLPLLGALAVALVVISVQMQGLYPANVNPPVSGGSRSSKNNVPTIPPPSEEEEEPGGEETPPGEDGGQGEEGGQGEVSTPPEEGEGQGHGEGGHGEGMEQEVPGEEVPVEEAAGAVHAAAVLSTDYTGCWEPAVPHHLPTHSERFMTDFEFDAETRAVRSGLFGDASTWSSGRVPTRNDRVLIPAGITVTVGHGRHEARSVVFRGRLIFQNGAGVRPELYITGGCGALVGRGRGELHIGSRTTPVVDSATIIFGATAIDTRRDPGQYGNGLLALDQTKVRIFGRPLEKTFVRQAGPALAGRSTITVAEPVRDWRPGDTIFLVDTRQLPIERSRMTDWQIEQPTIRSISPDGRTITIDGTLRHTHVCQRTHGQDLCPHVGNVTRNVVIMSESDEARGHTMFTEHADVDIRYAGFIALGRTLAAGLDSTTFDTDGVVQHIGTNQIGRYSLHFHHLAGPTPGSSDLGDYQYIAKGNAVADVRKWGITIHNSHWGNIADNVLVNGHGNGLTTEIGNETGNNIANNFSVGFYGFGPPYAILDAAVPGGFQSFPGDGFWLYGFNNRFTRNVAANNRWTGFHLWGYGHDTHLAFPTRRGVLYHEDPGSFFFTGRFHQSDETEFSDMEAYANGGGSVSGADIGGYGIQGWSLPYITFVRYTSWNNSAPHFTSVYGWAARFLGWRAASEGGSGLAAGWGTDRYTQRLEIEDCLFDGFSDGVIHMGSYGPDYSFVARRCRSDSPYVFLGTPDGVTPQGTVDISDDTNFEIVPF